MKKEVLRQRTLDGIAQNGHHAHAAPLASCRVRPRAWRAQKRFMNGMDSQPHIAAVAHVWAVHLSSDTLSKVLVHRAARSLDDMDEHVTGGACRQVAHRLATNHTALDSSLAPAPLSSGSRLYSINNTRGAAISPI
eukprot:CAMPEP_0119491220 /NCGR_PEP_ID=MMETSP1344-20130328/16163_1 /TAXON_ID=236787 /ORGANISM="Florenciella parvula, Strain CCMP2471" /LENGTH=135 /DNA_ID=CAMNT_0007526457 /DNA_START=730 /DNA_END=1137 /DNA_ORIENTATION=-